MGWSETKTSPLYERGCNEKKNNRTCAGVFRTTKNQLFASSSEMKREAVWTHQHQMWLFSNHNWKFCKIGILPKKTISNDAGSTVDLYVRGTRDEFTNLHATDLILICV